MQVWTDFDGAILEVSPAAADLLNVSPRSVARRAFYLFFTTQRHVALRELDRATRGHSGEFQAALRPRERKVIQVQVALEPAPPNAVLWTLTALKHER